MVIVDDAANHFDAFTFRTVSIEYNRIPYYHYRILQYSEMYTKWEANKIHGPTYAF
jgi:hypothetical protein